ncbi:MAG: hypothetical protein QOE31_403, partial [Solirubrobacteraceae bacterium]|nr:hypothetical protein [Solirubrobacteraceae bacterium]
MPLPKTAQAPPRIQIVEPTPMIDCGRFAAKRTVGETFEVGAEIFTDGHDVVRAVVRFAEPGSKRWHESPLRRIDSHIAGDHWAGEFVVTKLGPYAWTIEAWIDAFAGWRGELQRKIDAGQSDVSGELSEGVVLLEQAAARAKGADKKLIAAAQRTITDSASTDAQRYAAALDPELLEAIGRHPDRSHATTMDRTLRVDVDPERARFGAWYELFPRSWGGFQGVRERIPELAELGFDVLYLPPVHPIGRTHRKGRNNAPTARRSDPGSPWAIGSEAGGHTALHPDLGDEAAFTSMTAHAAELGIAIALDFAVQCSPDHPWL